jgi:hypothetical protein
VAVNYGDKTPIEYYGYLPSCQLRNSLLTSTKPFNYDTKTFDTTHVYTRRGLYHMVVFGYDERYYAEATLDLVTGLLIFESIIRFKLHVKIH